jgi:hypothetical protein
MTDTGGKAGMWTGLKAGHVSLVGRFWAKFALRTGGGIVFLLILLLTGLFVAQGYIWPVERMVESKELREATGGRASSAEILQEVARIKDVRDFVGWVSGGDQEQTSYLLDQNPALLSAILMTLMMFIPFLACYGGFNQTSGDIQNRGMRYLLLRTERANIFFGRFLGVVVFTAIYMFVVLAVVVLYLALKLRIYDAGALAAWGVQGYLALVIGALPYLAICSWISAAIDSPFGSLVLCLLLTGLPIVFMLALAGAVQVDYDTLVRFLPWGWKHDLLHGEPLKRLLAIGVMLGFTSLFTLLGLRTFHRRDL